MKSKFIIGALVIALLLSVIVNITLFIQYKKCNKAIKSYHNTFDVIDDSIESIIEP